MQSSLIPERPLVISPTLAATIGLDEAVMLHVLSELIAHRPVREKDRFAWIERAAPLRAAFDRFGARVPIGTQDWLGAVTPFQQLAGHQLARRRVDCARARHVALAQEARYRVAIECRAEFGIGAQRFEFGAEEQFGARMRVIERFDAEPVADQPQRARLPVPQRNREHAHGLGERGFDAPAHEAFE